jgi:hypothetical protein
MAHSGNSPLAFPAEVARYLCMEPRDIERMTRLDGLPYLNIPKAKKTVKRIPLRAFHEWLRKRSKNSAIASYDVFLADFNKTARKSEIPQTTP